MMTSRYLFRPTNEEDAREIAAWRYEAPYDFYDMTNDPEGLEKLLGPPERRRGYYAVLSGGELVGFFCYSLGGQLPGFDYPGDGCIDIGLGLRPDLTGKGLGLKFIRAGLQFGRRRFSLPPSGSPSLPSTSARSESTSARASGGRGSLAGALTVESILSC
jgi:[ribosomal protein S18]-alanine N-acetyltransferase